MFWLFISITWGFLAMWLPMYLMRHKHPFFMYMHREFYLHSFWRKGMGRFFGFARIVGVAGSMEMYRRDASDNKNEFNKFMGGK